MTEKLLSYYKVKGFSSLLVCFAFILCGVMTFIRYVGVDFTFGVLHCVLYIKEFRYIEVLFHTFYCNIGRAEEYRSLYTEDFVIQRFVKSRFHCTVKLINLPVMLH